MRAFLVLLTLLGSAFSQGFPTAPSGKFPALNVQVTVGTKQRPTGNDGYHKTMSGEPKVSIEAVSRMVAVPAAQATMLIITMDTKAKFKGNRDSFLVHANQTIPIPAAASGERRQFEFAEFSTTFDSYRDSSNVGGTIYKYYVFALRDPETKALIDFKTNNPSLATFCTAHPEKREEFLGIAKGKPFPADFK